MTRGIFTRAAEASLEAIGCYTQEQWGREQRNAYLDALEAACRDLANLLLKGKTREEIGAGIRSHPEGSHVIFYAIADEGIIVLDILHERMDFIARMRRG